MIILHLVPFLPEAMAMPLKVSVFSEMVSFLIEMSVFKFFKEIFYILVSIYFGGEQSFKKKREGGYILLDF